jgi:putative hemolysin
MDVEPAYIIRLAFVLAVQCFISGGFSAFVIVSRMHEDKVFPRDMRGSWIPRRIHRGRLQLILILIGLEVLVVSLAALLIYRLSVNIGLPDGPLWISHVLHGAVIAVVILAVTLLGIIVSTREPRRFAFAFSYPVFPFYLLLRPLATLFVKLASLAFPYFLREIATPFFLFPEGENGGEGFIEENGGRLMHSIFEFGVKKVREVMVPRIDVFAIDVHSSLDELRDKISRAGHSRVPVYDGSIDRIVGILYVKDLVWILRDDVQDAGMDRFVRDAYFVPEGKKIDELLREFQLEKKHMAVVVDEYGGTSGIVTLEDILEEIVGEIRDEYDQEAPIIRKRKDNEYEVAGRMNIGELNETLKIDIPSDEVDTIAGFLYNMIGRVPGEGDEVRYEGIDFVVSRLDGQRISEVIVRLPERHERRAR